MIDQITGGYYYRGYNSINTLPGSRTIECIRKAFSIKTGSTRVSMFGCVGARLIGRVTVGKETG